MIMQNRLLVVFVLFTISSITTITSVIEIPAHSSEEDYDLAVRLVRFRSLTVPV